jgi:hypothetical protein
MIFEPNFNDNPNNQNFAEVWFSSFMFSHQAKILLQQEKLQQQQQENSAEILRIQHELQKQQLQLQQQMLQQQQQPVQQPAQQQQQEVKDQLEPDEVSSNSSSRAPQLSSSPLKIAVPAITASVSTSVSTSVSIPPQNELVQRQASVGPTIHKCHHCFKVFAQKSDLHRHMKVS